MLQIFVKGSEELWNSELNEFISTEDQVLQLEHSLLSISKWESIYHKPFLSTEEKTDEETIHYIKCMTINKNVDPNIYYCLDSKNIQDIKEYIENPMTATTITVNGGKQSSRDIITSELIYYWMIALQVPFECERWHINRLLMLIKICEIKNQPTKKMSKSAILNQNAKLNAARRKALNSKG